MSLQRRTVAYGAALLTLSAGCYSSGTTPIIDAGVAVDASSELQPFSPGPVSIRRLTRAQYHNVIKDLFGDKVVVPELEDPDLAQGGLLSVGAAETTFSARGVSSIEEAALSVAKQAMGDEAQRRRWITCTPTGARDELCSREVLSRLGRAAWRRPLTPDEVERVATLADDAGATLGGFEAGLEYGIAALLQSPNFTFRVELGQDGPDGTRRFDAFELASRLSFFLWNSAPDETLLDRAADGSLDTDDGLRAEATRLLASPRARDGLRSFFSDQLQLYRLDSVTKDPTLFEQWSTELGPDAREETLLLLLDLVVDRDGDFRDIMTTTRTALNPRLAALYGVPAPTQSGFRLVDMPAEAKRAGLLTHASILNTYAHQVSTSATRRGKFVRTVLLCQDIPVPPVEVDTSIPEPSGTALTLRDRVKEHVEEESCAGCHNALDPIGLGLENYDAIGRLRTYDNGALIDPSGDLDGAAFDDAAGLGAAIRNHAAFAPCVVQTLVRYANGRVETPSEDAALTALANRFADLGYRLQPMLLEIVMSPLFRQAGAPR